MLALKPAEPAPDWLVCAPTLSELARRAGIDAEGLDAQVAEFNAFAERGEDPMFGRGSGIYDRYRGDPRISPNPNLRPLGPGPYYALEMRIGGLGTKGGPVIDSQARALDPEGRPIPGLYAAGNVAASVMGPSYPGPGATLGPATTFGRLAGESLAPSDRRRS